MKKFVSFILVAINLIGFLIIGPAILEAGHKHKDQEGFDQFKYFCGNKIGVKSKKEIVKQKQFPFSIIYDLIL